MTYTLTRHVERQAEAKGITLAAVWEAVLRPTITYESRNHPGQVRHINGDVCVVLDPACGRVITVYANTERTPTRPDQATPSPVIAAIHRMAG